MNDNGQSIQDLILELIATGREDDWWDFKETHHTDKASLLHDIICLANNRADRDAYLIFGIRDKTMEIIGVEEDPNRRNQQNIVDFLRTIEFAGQLRPKVEVRTVALEGHQIDVFIVKNSTDVPYYLIKDFTINKENPGQRLSKKTVHAYHIYTRVLDNNTIIDKSADLYDVELLWKKRFGLLQTPLKQIHVLLKKPDEWIEEDSKYYHKIFPQYTIETKYEQEKQRKFEEDNKEFYHYLQTDSSTRYGTLKIFHYSTQLFSCQITALDGYRMKAPCPQWEFLYRKEDDECPVVYKYYTMDAMEYRLLRFLEYKMNLDNGYEAKIATERLLEVVLLFESEKEQKQFNRYVQENFDEFDALIEKMQFQKVYGANEGVSAVDAERIRNSQALKQMQNKWKK